MACCHDFIAASGSTHHVSLVVPNCAGAECLPYLNHDGDQLVLRKLQLIYCTEGLQISYALLGRLVEQVVASFEWPMYYYISSILSTSQAWYVENDGIDETTWYLQHAQWRSIPTWNSLTLVPKADISWRGKRIQSQQPPSDAGATAQSTKLVLDNSTKIDSASPALCSHGNKTKINGGV